MSKPGRKDWRSMNEWDEDDWSEYLAFMYPSQDTFLKQVEDAINNTLEPNENAD